MHVFSTSALLGVVSFMPRALHSRGKSPRYPLDGRLGGPQNRSGRCGGEKNLPYLDSSSDPSAVQPVASRYTDHTVPAVMWEGNIEMNLKEVG
jgi:hypothetical protein